MGTVILILISFVAGGLTWGAISHFAGKTKTAVVKDISAVKTDVNKTETDIKSKI